MPVEQPVISIVLFDQSDASYKITRVPVSVVKGQWYEFTWTYDGISQPRAFLNGVTEGTLLANVGTYTAMENSTQPLIIGTDGWVGTNSVNGYIDEVALFNIELTPGQVASIHSKHLLGLALTD